MTWSVRKYVFISVIENLPMEMRERFTDMRELDLKVESEFQKRGKDGIVPFSRLLQQKIALEMAPGVGHRVCSTDRWQQLFPPDLKL